MYEYGGWKNFDLMGCSVLRRWSHCEIERGERELGTN